MARLQRLLNLLVWGLAVVIAWTERRDPTRPSASAENAPAEDASDEREPAPAPSRPAEEPALAGDADRDGPEDAGEPVSNDRATESPAPSPAAVDDPEPAPTATEEVATPPHDTAPTAAAPIFAETPPGVPIVGTAVPIPPARGGERPVPAGAVPGDETATCPPDYPIKGNASSMIYHRPGQPSYERTVAEFCFASEADAEGAGYRPPRR